MRIILTSGFIVLICNFGKAQYISIDKPKYKVVHQDTINIKGIVYDAFKNPVPLVQIHSKNKQYAFDGLYNYTITHPDGRFELRGALVKDTLDVFASKKYSFVNNGSRYIEITLPPLYPHNDVTLSAEVVSPRRAKKITPAFKIVTNANINDYYGITHYLFIRAEYPGGFEKFIENIKKKIIYPAKSIENNIEGEVEIGFSIQKDGSFFNYQVIKGIGYGCDEAVINTIKNSGRWRPAFLNGLVVTDQSSVTIIFRLTDK